MASRNRSPSESTERTPLISREEGDHEVETPKKKESTTRWPSFIALAILCILVIFAIVFGFAAPAAVEEYAKEAIVFEPTSISIDSFTNLGVKAHLKALFYLDGRQVQRKPVRDLGRAATWIAHKVESGEAEVEVYLPEYGNTLLGVIKVPPVQLNVRDQRDNFIDIVSDIRPGNITGIRSLAHDVLDGKQSVVVRVVGSANVRSGIINLGRKTVSLSMTLHRSGNTKMPKFDISNLRVAEFGIPTRPQGLIATANVTARNPLPVKFDVPPLSFEAMLMDCAEKPLVLGTMSTDMIHVLPKTNVTAGITGLVRQLPSALTQACPGTQKSPLDTFVRSYLEGNRTTVYVRGGQQDVERTPQWINDILRETMVSVPLPSHPLKNTIKRFSLSQVHFNLPKDGSAFPEISAIINVVVGVPKFVNVGIMVDRVRADADVFFKGKKLGNLNLHQWQKSSSKKVGDELRVESEVKNAPLEITDQHVFSQVLQEMIFGKSGVDLSVRANVDVSTNTALGAFMVRNIPGHGKIHIKPLGKGGMSRGFNHTIKHIGVVKSSPKEVVLRTTVVVQNPTAYSAQIPYVNISIWCNGTQLGNAWGSFNVTPGTNELVVDGSLNSGPVGAELLSQYISGRNVSLTMKTHEGSVPGLPDPQLSIAFPVPHSFGKKFLKETTMHILSSTATFVIFCPIDMTITDIVARSYYKGKAVGNITYPHSFDIIGGQNNTTPSLPVNWDLNDGLKLIRPALGGRLKLDAHANIGVRIGQWKNRIWYEGHGLGAKIKFFLE